MAFSLYASTGSTTTQLNNGSPFWLESAEGLSGAPVVRHSQSGPLQSGVTDLGYRLQPRVVTLNLLFYASSDSTLDSYRQTLTSAFNPLPDISTFLTVQRDDGEIRTLVCRTVGEIKIELVPEERAGHLHRATVQLRAADPTWKSNSVTSASYDYGSADPWWLAGGTISESQIISIAEYPAPAQPWVGYKGTTLAVNAGTPWAVAIITAKHTADASTIDQYAWADYLGSAGLFYDYTASRFMFNSMTNSGVGFLWPGSATENYHVIQNTTNSMWTYGSAGTIVHYAVGGGRTRLDSGGRWRWRYASSNWGPELRKALIIRDQTEAQIIALRVHMLANNLGTTNTFGSVNVVNDGDVPVYPLITLTGPMADVVITNQTTGDTIDLTGLSLSGTTSYILDLRDGNKALTDTEGNNAMGSVTTSPVGLASFYIAPAPTAAGGTNVITLTLGSTTADAQFSVEITNRYLSF